MSIMLYNSFVKKYPTLSHFSLKIINLKSQIFTKSSDEVHKADLNNSFATQLIRFLVLNSVAVVTSTLKGTIFSK